MIPRQIPDQSWYMQSLFSVLIGGILPFGAVFIELFFILSSVWLNQVRHAHPAWSHRSFTGFLVGARSSTTYSGSWRWSS